MKNVSSRRAGECCLVLQKRALWFSSRRWAWTRVGSVITEQQSRDGLRKQKYQKNKLEGTLDGCAELDDVSPGVLGWCLPFWGPGSWKPLARVDFPAQDSFGACWNFRTRVTQLLRWQNSKQRSKARFRSASTAKPPTVLENRCWSNVHVVNNVCATHVLVHQTASRNHCGQRHFAGTWSR